MKVRFIFYTVLALAAGAGIYLLQERGNNQPRVEIKPSLATQQEELVKATRASGGDVAAALAKFRKDHADELRARAEAEANQGEPHSYERDQLRAKAQARLQRIREIQEEIRSGKDPSQIVPPND